jgi:hypothetical protein
MRRFRGLLAAAALAAIAGCGSPALDAGTVEHLTALREPGGAAACDEYVVYEESKRDAADPCTRRRFDEKSLRNVRAACDCWRTRPSDEELVEASCRVMIDAFLAYEHAKDPCPEE